MFFLGAGFMLVETKAVVHMALLFGGTWMVNSVVFFAVLVMILAPTCSCSRAAAIAGAVLRGLLAVARRQRAGAAGPFLGLPRGPQIAASCLLAFTPILFAGVIFAVSFGRVPSRPRLRGEHRRRDVRRPGGVQLDAARLSVSDGGGAGVLPGVVDQRLARDKRHCERRP